MSIARTLRSDVKSTVKDGMKQLFAHQPLRKLLCWRIPERSAPVHIALTFDDGPHATFTPQVLDVLAEHSIRATFFVVGSYIEDHPHIFQRLLDEGHEFGVHGYVHNNIELPKQTRVTLEVMSRFGASTKLFRPPHGKLDVRTSMWMARHGFSTVLWSFDCRDSLRYEGKDGPRRELDQIGPGDIVLLHDDNPVCVEDLKLLVELIKRKNLQTRTISEMLAAA